MQYTFELDWDLEERNFDWKKKYFLSVYRYQTFTRPGHFKWIYKRVWHDGMDKVGRSSKSARQQPPLYRNFRYSTNTNEWMYLYIYSWRRSRRWRSLFMFYIWSTLLLFFVLVPEEWRDKSRSRSRDSTGHQWNTWVTTCCVISCGFPAYDAECGLGD